MKQVVCIAALLELKNNNELKLYLDVWSLVCLHEKYR